MQYVQGKAVIPGVGTSAMPVASVPSIKSYIHQNQAGKWNNNENITEHTYIHLMSLLDS